MKNPGPTQQNCKSCDAPLQGDYCHRCGEKVIDPKRDYALAAFAKETIDGFANLDWKLFKSFRLLFFKPGVLTSYYVEGRRVNFTRPIQIFILASVLFYFVMPNTGSFYASFDELNNGYQSPGFSLENPFKYNIKADLRALTLRALGTSAPPDSLLQQKANAIYRTAYAEAANRSKTYLFLVLPFWALLLYGLFYRQNRYYVPHLIFAMHSFAVFLLLDLAFLVFYFNILKLQVVENETHLLPFFGLMLLYLVLAVKKFYAEKTLNAIGKGVLVYSGLLALLLLYRTFITFWALHAVA